MRTLQTLFLTLLAFGLALPALAQPARDPDNKWIVVCTDGHRVRVTPFNQNQNDAQLCGEAPQDVPVSAFVPEGFEAIYGPRPKGSSLDQRVAKAAWDSKLEEFVGLVPEPQDAVQSAAIAKRFCFGSPAYFESTKGQVKWTDEGVKVSPGVLVAFPDSVLGSSTDIGVVTLEKFVTAPHIILARQQLQLEKRGLVIPDACRHPFAQVR